MFSIRRRSPVFRSATIIGGNPLLEGVWFFGNGMVCFKTSYDFFMIALDGQEDVEKMVKEIKGCCRHRDKNSRKKAQESQK